MADLSKLVACRLPQALIAAAQRHADLYHTSVSELLRQGLEYRLTYKAWPPDTHAAPSNIPAHVHEVLTELARRLDQVRQELGSSCDPPARAYNSYTFLEDTPQDETREVETTATPYEDISPYNSYTSEAQPSIAAEKGTENAEMSNGITSASETSQPGFDPALFVLGKLCPRGHAYRGTTQTLLRLPARICPQCHAARQRARRQRKEKT